MGMCGLDSDLTYSGYREEPNFILYMNALSVEMSNNAMGRGIWFGDKSGYRPFIGHLAHKTIRLNDTNALQTV